MVCVMATVGDQSVTVRLPGGATLQPMISVPFPTNLQIVKNLLSQASSALAPLLPVFNIIDAIIAIKDFASSVPELIVNPPAVVEAITNLVEKVAALASLIPQLSVPLLIVDLVGVVILALQGLVTELQAIVEQLERIEAARQIAQDEGNVALLEMTICADDLLASVQENLSNSLGPLNSLFSVINIFLELIGQDPIPTLDDLPDDPNEAIDTLNALVETLTIIRQAIPIP